MILKNIEKIENRKTVIIAISDKGRKLAEKIKIFFPNADVYLSQNNLTEIFKKCFENHKNIIAIMATGIVVRKVAPFLKSKKKDPAVVVLDEQGKFAISLISGHLGGANELAMFIGNKINSIPVITTATDINKKPAIDIIPRKTGWEIENTGFIKKINSGVLKNKQIATNIPEEFLIKLFPEFNNDAFKNFIFFKNEEEVLKSNIELKVVLSNRLNISGDFLLFRPKNLYIGIGCNRGTLLEEIENCIFKTLKKIDRSYKSINSISSFEIKSDEPGLIAFSKKYNIPLTFYNRDEINSVQDNYKPSEYLIKNIGVKGVCEPSAILSAEQDMSKCFERKTLLPKIKSGNVTLAIQELRFI